MGSTILFFLYSVLKMNTHQFILLITLATYQFSPTKACCCTLDWVKDLSYHKREFSQCGCNLFGCNCNTNEDGYCLYRPVKQTTSIDGRFIIKDKFSGKCSNKPYASLPESFKERACDEPKRNKRSIVVSPSYLKYSKSHPKLAGNKIMDIFASIDIDGNGVICKKEAKKYLGRSYHSHKFHDMDTNQDGLIQPGEFDLQLD